MSTRIDKISSDVAAGMLDYDTLCEVLKDSVEESIRNGDVSPLLSDIASAICSASQPGISQAHLETIGTRLLHSLERYARASLTAKAEDDMPQDDEEEDDGQ